MIKILLSLSFISSWVLDTGKALASEWIPVGENEWGWGTVLEEDPAEVAKIGQKIQPMLGIWEGVSADNEETCRLSIGTSALGLDGDRADPKSPTYTWPVERNVIFINGAPLLSFSLESLSKPPYAISSFGNEETLRQVRRLGRTLRLGQGRPVPWFLGGPMTAEEHQIKIELSHSEPWEALETSDLWVYGLSSNRREVRCLKLKKL